MTVNAVPTPTAFPIQFGQRDAKVIETATLATGTISNKTIDSSNTIAGSLAGAIIKSSSYIADVTDVTKTLKFSLGSATSGADLTLASAQTADHTLTIPVLGGNDTLMTLGLAQTVTGVLTFNAAPVISSITNGAATLTLPTTTCTLSGLGLTETFSAIKTFTIRPCLDNSVGLQFKELDANGENFVFLKGPDDCNNADKTVVLPNHSCTMPAADGSSGQVIQTNGSGVWSFATVAYKLATFTVDHAAITLGTPLLVGTAIPAGSIVVAGGVQITEAFTGSVDGTATMKFGLEDADDDLMIAAAVSGAPWSTTGIKTFTGTEGAALDINTPATGWYVQTVGKQLNVTTVANNDVSLTAGTAIIHILYI